MLLPDADVEAFRIALEKDFEEPITEAEARAAMHRLLELLFALDRARQARENPPPSRPQASASSA